MVQIPDTYGKTTVGQPTRLGEQGDAMMPLLFSLAQHPALEAVQAQFLEGEFLFAYSDDIYIVFTHERTGAVSVLLQNALWHHAGIRVHQSKNQSLEQRRRETCNL